MIRAHFTLCRADKAIKPETLRALNELFDAAQKHFAELINSETDQARTIRNASRSCWRPSRRRAGDLSGPDRTRPRSADRDRASRPPRLLPSIGSEAGKGKGKE